MRNRIRIVLVNILADSTIEWFVFMLYVNLADYNLHIQDEL